jgi:hypothetical protein
MVGGSACVFLCKQYYFEGEDGDKFDNIYLDRKGNSI